MVDIIAQNRYTSVKAQLDSLHYCQPFSKLRFLIDVQILRAVHSLRDCFPSSSR